MTAAPFSKETVGEYLRREREARRVTLEEISGATRISRPYLEALERNDFRFFSRPEYIQGFLKGYARHIGLNPAEVLKRYEIQLERARLRENFHQLPLFYTPGDSLPDEGGERPAPPGSPPPLKKKRVSRSILIQILLLTAALSLSFYLYLAIKQIDKNSKGAADEFHAGPAGGEPETGKSADLPSGNAQGEKTGEKSGKPGKR